MYFVFARIYNLKRRYISLYASMRYNTFFVGCAFLSLLCIGGNLTLKNDKSGVLTGWRCNNVDINVHRSLLSKINKYGQKLFRINGKSSTHSNTVYRLRSFFTLWFSIRVCMFTHHFSAKKGDTSAGSRKRNTNFCPLHFLSSALAKSEKREKK